MERKCRGWREDGIRNERWKEDKSEGKLGERKEEEILIINYGDLRRVKKCE